MANDSKTPRIGTVTLQRVINYGALLQVYALQKKINELGGYCIVLDYRNSLLENRHRQIKRSNCRFIKDYIRLIFIAKNHNKKYQAFREFSRKYVNLSNPYYSVIELKDIVSEYDKFITGSDQVWNYQITGNDATYFLSFVDNNSKINSYAASFGFKEIPAELKDQYYYLLSDFNNLSVRETQGSSIIKKLLDKDVEVVLDPTLLLPKEQWFEIADEHIEHDDYILIYTIGKTNHLFEFAKNLSRKSGYKIIQISNPYIGKIGFKYEKKAGPERFLGLFKNAKYIVTNSFHGTCFSINFNKQFFLEMLSESTVNSRLEDILDLFDLRSRQILSPNQFETMVPINFDNMNAKVEEERKKSTKFLNKIIWE